MVTTHIRQLKNECIIRAWGIWETVNHRRLFYGDPEPFRLYFERREGQAFGGSGSAPERHAGRARTRAAEGAAHSRPRPWGVETETACSTLPAPARGPSCPRGPSPGPGNRDVGRTAQVSGAGHWDRTHSGRGFLFFPARTAWRICGGARELSTTCSMGAPTPFCPLASALCSNLGDRESGRKAHKVKPPLTIELPNFRSSPKR